MVGKRKITLEDTDEFIEEMYQLAESDAGLKTKLKAAGNWQSRWATLERYILRNLDKIGLESKFYYKLWIRERFFYAMQQRTKEDYGFCPHFIPAFRAKTESILTDNLKIDMVHKCTYMKETLDTTCSGTDRDRCVVLHPELKIRDFSEDYGNN